MLENPIRFYFSSRRQAARVARFGWRTVDRGRSRPDDATQREKKLSEALFRACMPAYLLLPIASHSHFLLLLSRARPPPR